jgi:hypothetical protein
MSAARRRRLTFALTLLTAFAFAGTALASGWHVIGRAHSSGDFAATATNATAKHPHALAVLVHGSGVSGFAAVACTKGFSVGAKSTSYKGAGLHQLRLPIANAESCDVTASIGGSGHISISILAK